MKLISSSRVDLTRYRVQFFKLDYLKQVVTFWGGVIGLSFAFSAVVGEFISSCVFVFAKHPYDIGDYIEAKGKKLIVIKIFLTYTNFEEVTSSNERGVVL